MDIVEYKTLMPQSMGDKMKMAATLAKSKLVPKALDTAEKVFLAIQWGHELGLTPMVAINNVAVINGKPTISSDLMFSIVSNHKEYAGRDIKGDAKSCTVTIKRKRKTGMELSTNTFSMEEAKVAGLTGKDVWKKYPARMLKHRAMSYSCRDAFPDALSGLYSKEEMEHVNEKPEIIEAEITEVQKEPEIIEAEITETTEESEIIEAEITETTEESEIIEAEKEEPKLTPLQIRGKINKLDYDKIEKILQSCNKFVVEELSEEELQRISEKMKWS